MATAFERHMEQLRKDAQNASIKKMLGSGGFASGQKKEQRQQKADRLLADVHDPENGINSIILSKADVKGTYDSKRMLETTLDGQRRPITRKDLEAFEANIATAKEKFEGGITPQQVIDMSLREDIQRSNEQIHLAAVFSRKGSVFRFMTNASATSKVTRHYVDVEMLGYSSMLTGAKDPSVYVIKQNVSGGKVRFDCDCGRHRYWFRFIATKGKFNFGMREDGYPKIRNPHLVGIACKHVLRVMHQIQSGSGVQYIKKQIEKDRANSEIHDKTQANSVAQVRKDLAQKVEVSHHKRNKVLQSHEKPTYVRKLQRQAATEAARAMKAEQVNKAKHQLRKEKIAGLEAAYKANILTKSVYEALLKDVGN